MPPKRVLTTPRKSYKTLDDFAVIDRIEGKDLETKKMKTINPVLILVLGFLFWLGVTFPALAGAQASEDALTTECLHRGSGRTPADGHSHPAN
jgi:hypothetical protein